MARLMKHSGIEWLGEIPAHWKLAPLKAVCSCFGRIGFRGYTQEDLVDEGEGAITLSPTNIIDSKLTLKKCSYISWNKYYESPEIMLFKGDIVFVKTASVGKCAIYDSDEKATVNPQFVVLKDIKCDRKFLFYTLISSVIQSPLALSNFGSVIGTITQKQLLSYKVCIPPLDEQQRIAAYLDDKCGRIDSVIAKTVATVDEYKKLKQAIITRAVTRGIRANRTLKHSGIDWLGDIPDDWNVKKIKMCISFVNGFAFESSVLEKEGTYPVIRIGDIKNGTVDFMNANFINESTLQLEPFRIKKNDILIAMSGATVGKLAYITDEPPISFINQRVGIIRSSLGKFIYYCLSTDNFMKYILLLSEGTAQPNISTKNINNYYITIPPIDEQREIAAYLDEKTAAIDSLVAKKNQLVAELERLKKSLIFEYVTGKKEVAQ